MTELSESQFDEERVREDGIEKPLILAATMSLFLKLKLEKQLSKKLQKRYKAYLTEIVNTYAKYGYLPMFTDLRNDVENILNDHYINVGKAFDEFLRIELGARTDDEGFNKRLSDIIRIRAYNRAHQSANKTVRTTEKDTDRILRLILATAALEGLILSRSVISRQLKNILSVVFKNRIKTTAITETAYASEQTKFDEALAMIEMNVTLPDGRKMDEIDLHKQWIARFINTRPWHEDAHGQIKFFDEPYIVKEEELMFPTDESLGASLDNIINCYCSSHIFIV